MQLSASPYAAPMLAGVLRHVPFSSRHESESRETLPVGPFGPSLALYYICGIAMYVEHNAPTGGTNDGARIS